MHAFHKLALIYQGN